MTTAPRPLADLPPELAAALARWVVRAERHVALPDLEAADAAPAAPTPPPEPVPDVQNGQRAR